jgi:serine/threonine protein kinase
MTRPQPSRDPRHDLTPVSDISLVQRAAPIKLADFPYLNPPAADGELGRFHHYRVLRLLGQGGMGIVFLAEDMQQHRLVALKVLHPKLASHQRLRRRFLREARAMAAVRSEHIVAVYQIGSTDSASALSPDVSFLAMEYLEGETLETRLRREKTLRPGETARIGREIACGLAAAHGKGLVHRDIKPANIWLSAPNGRVKILDFGLVRVIDEEAALSKSGQIIGTPSFMSPEQAKGEKVDARSDLFSLGSVLYLALCGEVPFRGSNPVAVVRKLTTQEPEPLCLRAPNVPPELAVVVWRLLAKDPAERPESAAAVAESLAAIEAGCLLTGTDPNAAALPVGPAPPAGNTETISTGCAETGNIIVLAPDIGRAAAQASLFSRRRLLITAAGAAGAAIGLAAFSAVRRVAGADRK